jgi:hypothetical protein
LGQRHSDGEQCRHRASHLEDLALSAESEAATLPFPFRRLGDVEHQEAALL